jgi:hypothetical protein
MDPSGPCMYEPCVVDRDEEEEMTYGDGGGSPAGRSPLGTAAREALAELSSRAVATVRTLADRPVVVGARPVLHAVVCGSC